MAGPTDAERLDELELRAGALEVALRFVIATLPETQRSRLEAAVESLLQAQASPAAVAVAELLSGPNEGTEAALLDEVSALQQSAPPE